MCVCVCARARRIFICCVSVDRDDVLVMMIDDDIVIMLVYVMHVLNCRRFITNYINYICISPSHVEGSKYSCVYQGESAHADAAARRHFVPNGCSLASPGPGDWEKVFTPGRTVYFVGDSLVRQVFIAMGCLLSQYLDLQANTSNLIQR